jgi:flagellar biogenesis protein FliO
MNSLIGNSILTNPKTKLILAFSGLILLVSISILSQAQLSMSSIARGILALACIGVFGVWFLKQKAQGGTKFINAPRLQVVQRIGLSQKSQVALIEADGRQYLIVHGEGFATVKPLRTSKIIPLGSKQGNQS